MRATTYHIFFNNLSNRLRVEIISSLKEKGKSVNELVKDTKEEQSKISHALAGLRRCNLVNFRQKGKIRIYSLNRKTMMPLLKIIDAHSMENCEGVCKKCSVCKIERSSL